MCTVELCTYEERSWTLKNPRHGVVPQTARHPTSSGWRNKVLDGACSDNLGLLALLRGGARATIHESRQSVNMIVEGP